MNTVILMGRMVRDPEIRQTQSGIAVCRFSVAVNRPFVNKETNEREADFLECEAWKQTAEFVGRYFQKGSMIAVEGSIRNNNYIDNNNVKHYATKIAVDRVHFCGSKQDGNGGGSQQTNQGAPQTYQQQPAHGGYNAPYAPQAPQQGQTYQQQPMPPQNAQRAPQQAAPQNLGNLEQFVDILSEGELPF